MNDYRVSVVIPNYNNADYIEDCIVSIENQTYPIEEIIVVDDCSKDNSLEVLDKLAKEYDNLQVIALKENGGVSHARNTGLAAVKTPYVIFIDGDDIYLNSDKIKNEMALVKKYKEEFGKDIAAYSRTWYLTRDGVPYEGYRYRYKHYNQGNIFKRIVTDKYAFTIMRDYCFSAEYLRRVNGYDEKSCLWEDKDVILKLSKEIEFYYTGEIGTGYRQTQSGLSSKPAKTHIERKREIFNNHTADFSKNKKTLYKVLKFIHKYENMFLIFWARVKGKVRKIKGGIKK